MGVDLKINEWHFCGSLEEGTGQNRAETLCGE